MAALELIIATPVLLLLIMAVAQFAAWEQGREVGETAAERGALAARVLTGTDAQGRSAAQAALLGLGPSLIRGPEVTVSRTATSVRVEIRGIAQSVVPFLSLPVDAVSEAPIERATAPGTGP